MGERWIAFGNFNHFVSEIFDRRRIRKFVWKHVWRITVGKTKTPRRYSLLLSLLADTFVADVRERQITPKSLYHCQIPLPIIYKFYYLDSQYISDYTHCEANVPNR